MKKIQLNKLQLTKGASIQEQEEGSGIFRLSKEGAGFLLPQLMTCEERYLTFISEIRSFTSWNAGMEDRTISESSSLDTLLPWQTIFRVLRLEAQLAESGSGYPFENWSAWGGWKEKKLSRYRFPQAGPPGGALNPHHF